VVLKLASKYMITQYTQSNMALGSEVTFTVVCDNADQKKCDDLFLKLWEQTFKFEKQFSRFIPNSELSHFNKAAGQRIAISKEFYSILIAAKKISEETNGLFNPFILPSLQKAGYTKSFAKGYELDTHADYSGRQLAEINNLEITNDWANIPYGTAIDLGGCGKGYLADQLANFANKKWIIGFWFSIGGDIVGSGLDCTNNPWVINIVNADGADTHKAFTSTGERFAAATSSTAVRKGAKWHHIIDPRTKKPANSDIDFVSVYSSSGLQADALASCAIILGSQVCIPFLKKRGIEAAYISGKTNNAVPFEHMFGAVLQMNEVQHA
jgi:thiamine biosynthesis lipoprotein